MALGTSATIRIVLSGVQGTLAGMTAVEGKLAGLTEEMALFSAEEKKATERSWLMNQALFTMRRYAYMGTLAATGLGLAFLKWGTDFNATMQSAELALKPMMGSTRAVKDELQTLFNMAKINPFTFADMTNAFRKMYIGLHPLGISTAAINRTLKDMVDALSAAGNTSPGALNRLSVALQHMAYSGRLTGFAVNQLMRDGIPIAAVLNKEFGITGDQLHNIAKFGIPAGAVLDAINKYIEQTPGLANAAARQAKTLGGELATLHDNIAQTMGALTAGAFARTTGPGGLLQSINNTFNGVAAIIKKQHGRISLDQVFGVIGKKYPVLSGLLDLIGTWVQYMHPVLRLTWLFIQALLIMLSVLGKISLIFRPFISGFDWLLKHVPGLQYVILFLAAAWTLDYIAMNKVKIVTMILRPLTIALEAAQKILAGTMMLLRFVTLLLNKELWILLWNMIRVRVSLLLMNAAAIIGNSALWKLSISAIIATINFIRLRLAILATNAALWSLAIDNPIGLLITAVVLLVGGIIILYFKWKWFHDLVNRTFTWIWKNWKLVSAILVFILPQFAILLIVSRLLYDHWRDLWGLLKQTWSIIIGVGKWISDAFQDVYKWILKVIDKVKDFLGLWKKIPGAQFLVGAARGAWNLFTGGGGGGTFPMANAALATPGGALLTPQQNIDPFAAARKAQGKSPFAITIHNNVHIDGKQVATSVAKTNQKHRARK